MNITGTFRHQFNSSGGTILTDTSGAFSTKMYDVLNSGKALTSYRDDRSNLMSFDASKSWTGETSAVGGGASHTHGN